MSRPPWDEAGPVGDPGPELPSMIQPASPGLSSSRAGILGLGILALILLAAITWALGASSDAARETACERAGGHSYSTGRVVLCLDSEGRVIER